ncbi:hypothetical protein BGX38DRAFT_1215868 [Terfezia claveryi]|nr:hypothetical protein BGX38DRAFT_1215868 [Terfezia claveryi]
MSRARRVKENSINLCFLYFSSINLCSSCFRLCNMPPLRRYGLGETADMSSKTGARTAASRDDIRGILQALSNCKGNAMPFFSWHFVLYQVVFSLIPLYAVLCPFWFLV